MTHKNPAEESVQAQRLCHFADDEDLHVSSVSAMLPCCCSSCRVSEDEDETSDVMA